MVMNKTLLRAFVFTAIMAITASAQNENFDKIFKYYVADKNFSGVALVASEGKIEYLNGSGFSNRQTGSELTTKSKFRICSITKTFTAVIIMQLYEQGKIDLNAPISKYFPEYKGEGRDQISIDNLLTYSSGLDNIDQRDEAVYNTLMSPDVQIDKFFSGKPVSVPGKQFSYKNADFVILGKIIEKITGETFAEVLSRNILQPLGMTNSGYLKNGDIVNSLASSYLLDKTSGTFRNDDPFWIDNFYAAGAMYSTVEDLLKFDQAIFNYKILQQKTVDMMLVPRPALNSVGYGFWISPVKFGAVTARAADRQGSISGNNATWIHLPDQKKTVIIFSNTDASKINEMREKMVLATLGQPVSLPTAEKPLIANVAVGPNQIVGTWEIDLRPKLNSDPYLKDFIISKAGEKTISGNFYGSDFENGQLNTDWGKTYFAFTTGDKDATYFHSGIIEGNKISGVSYSPDRKFVLPWSGRKK